MAHQVAQSNGEFCFDLFRELSHSNVDSNVLFSPIIMYYALAMLYFGRGNQTASQLQKVLHLDKFAESEPPTLPQCKQPDNVHTALESVLSHIRALSTNHTLSIAIRLYVEQSYPLLLRYLKHAKKLYRADVEKVDFKNSPEQTRKAINAWVESQSNGLIKDMFASGSLTSKTTMALVNAIYFKGKWEHGFKKEDTKKMIFKVNKRVNKSVQMMHQISNFNFTSIKKPRVQVVELPYFGDLSMFVLLPENDSDLAQLQNLITYKRLQKLMDSMERKKVEVYLPRMNMEMKYNLTSILENLGVTDLFAPTANLSDISSAGGLAGSEIIHKAYLEVNEEGTNTAAATGTQIRLTSFINETPVLFRIDRPFIFNIVGKRSGVTYFSGQVFSP